MDGTVKNFLRYILKVDIHEFFQYMNSGQTEYSRMTNLETCLKTKTDSFEFISLVLMKLYRGTRIDQ